MKKKIVARPMVIILSDGLKGMLLRGVFLDVQYLGSVASCYGPMESQAGYFNGRIASNDSVCLHLTNSKLEKRL